MKVFISMKETGGCFEFDNVTNAYTKGPLYCIMTHNEDHSVVTIHKYPIAEIHSIAETSPSTETVLINSNYENLDRKKKKKKK